MFCAVLISHIIFVRVLAAQDATKFCEFKNPSCSTSAWLGTDTPPKLTVHFVVENLSHKEIVIDPAGVEDTCFGHGDFATRHLIQPWESLRLVATEKDCLGSVGACFRYRQLSFQVSDGSHTVRLNYTSMWDAYCPENPTFPTCAMTSASMTTTKGCPLMVESQTWSCARENRSDVTVWVKQTKADTESDLRKNKLTLMLSNLRDYLETVKFGASNCFNPDDFRDIWIRERESTRANFNVSKGCAELERSTLYMQMPQTDAIVYIDFRESQCSITSTTYAPEEIRRQPAVIEARVLKCQRGLEGVFELVFL